MLRRAAFVFGGPPAPLWHKSGASAAEGRFHELTTAAMALLLVELNDVHVLAHVQVAEGEQYHHIGLYAEVFAGARAL